jgi:iron complex outermembrane receptor protein
VDEVVVEEEGEDPLPFAATPATGSTLNLTVRETPAVVDVMTEQKIQDLGARTTEEALNRAPGVSSSIHATSPGALSLRGFTGSGRAVLLLYDGVRPAEEAFFTRVMDSFLFERIEVLQGPSSVNYGEGALAGVINLVPKRPRLGGHEVAAQTGFGSFGTFKAGGPSASRCPCRLPLSSPAACAAALSVR